MTASIIIVFALLSLGKTAFTAHKKSKEELMKQIETLAKEYKLDATFAKKILETAPEIVKEMPDDLRNYFNDLTSTDVNDEEKLNEFINAMCDYLRKHRNKAEKIINILNDDTQTGLSKENTENVR